MHGLSVCLMPQILTISPIASAQKSWFSPPNTSLTDPSVKI
jgi:hypothetical protein